VDPSAQLGQTLQFTRELLGFQDESPITVHNLTLQQFSDRTRHMYDTLAGISTKQSPWKILEDTEN